jgi:GT2 family glycosyltransferase
MSADTISLIMPTIDWGPTFQRCVLAAANALHQGDQLIVVFDGTAPPPPDWLLSSGATLLQTDRRQGPAAARNRAAAQARGQILWFVDADVELHADAGDRLRSAFQADPGLAAIFGSYDADPAAPGLVSRFRNLLHHHTHTSHPGPASTFWAGCGAVRRAPFLALGGFDAQTYPQPSIEDIDFGLRLHDAGARILLDPAIQGTHHKHWTFGRMLHTDIRQRAIPWSRLLLKRRELPTTLNLDLAARWSAALSLLIPAAAGLLLLPMDGAWPAFVAMGALALLFLINRSFLALLLRQGGIPLAVAGAALHALYLLYSTLSFLGVNAVESLKAPVGLPLWLRRRPLLSRLLIRTTLVLLTLLAVSATLKGVILLMQADDLAQPEKTFDLAERFDEWRVYREHIYPSAYLANPDQRDLPFFRTTVYLPWALPLFGLFFSWGGLAQGKMVILLASLASLGLMAWVGWQGLRPWGCSAGWLGALSPLAITSNSNALAHGQFSIPCMGLITLQWLLLLRACPLPAGLFWALAMVKPQIAAGFALPFLQKRQISGLVLGLGVLTGLTAAALTQTGTSPEGFLMGWLQTLPTFIAKGNTNLLAALMPLLGGLLNNAPVVLPVVLLSISGLGLTMGWWTLKRLQQDPLQLAGCCAVFGGVFFYHLHSDNIMMVPALLACLRNLFSAPCRGNLILGVLMALSLWTPPSMHQWIPSHGQGQSLIWLLVGAELFRQELNQPATRHLP